MSLTFNNCLVIITQYVMMRGKTITNAISISRINYTFTFRAFLTQLDTELTGGGLDAGVAIALDEPLSLPPLKECVN